MKKLSIKDSIPVVMISDYKSEDKLISSARLLKSFSVVDPVAVASYMICLYEAFERIIPEEKQLKFQSIVLDYFKSMFEIKDSHLETVKIYTENEEQD